MGDRELLDPSSAKVETVVECVSEEPGQDGYQESALSANAFSTGLSWSTRVPAYMEPKAI